ncbi:hypothetical protein SAMN02799630_04550 [Paenibacillus sp. UNCCL117]|uniref:hypothetical protein n=1 Tax=unclassified Paenibacillus TaxID=185978 RepID=UPI00088AB186|nr:MULTISPECIES: hypothetical protein [unclassified Paenibacillus]SDD64665.1 hypothetical protein SAMN04488602_11190 [Paenibacillus sp. cl123]SFW58277.1 hypothetical protein SAMN02799630_04550 [Paenibacillus sp. UNCCL117]
MHKSMKWLLPVLSISLVWVLAYTKLTFAEESRPGEPSAYHLSKGIQPGQDPAAAQGKEASIQETSRQYAEAMALWKQRSSSPMPSVARGARQTFSMKSANESAAEMNRPSVEQYGQEISRLLDQQDTTAAFELATKLLGDYPQDRQAKEQFAAVYKLYAVDVAKKQNELKAGAQP